MARARKQNSNTGEEDEPDLAEAFEEERNKPYYKVNYLDDFKLPFERLDVSVVIPTYNRCPYKPDSLKGELNPLSWAIKSLLLQKPVINEIIIVDDHSQDYTKKVVDSFKEEAKQKEVKLIYVRNKKKQGNSIARHIGAVMGNSKYVFFADDDCIIPIYCVFGAVYTFEKLAENGINVGAINLPTYFRSSLPNKAISKKEIGKIDFIRGLYTTNKDAFPKEYLNGKEKNKFIDVELHILEPFQITNFNTFGLCSKKAYQDVGGFKKTIIKRGLDREFGSQLIENGYLIYFLPDPKFHCVHGSYGIKSDSVFEGEDWFRKVGGNISLRKAMEECNKPSRSGMRINPKNYLQESITSFFVLTYPRNKKGALKWIKKVYSEFVDKGDSSIFGGIKVNVPAEKERKEMWEKAINNGLGWIKKKENIEIKKAEKIFKNLETDKKKKKKALKLMSEV